MEGSEWDDERRYPDAPVPAHERLWRHPSEFGQETWALSEPPVAIGRGLTAATGAIGGILALAVLWAMVPTEGGRDVVSARSTVATFVSGAFGLVDTTVRAEATSLPSVVTTGLPTSTTVAIPQPTITSTDPVDPTPTFQVSQLDTTTAAVAVAVAGGVLVLTTAIAVADQQSVDLRRADGTIERATVLLVDEATGLALLEPEAADGSASYSVGDAIEPGDELTLVASGESTMTVSIDGTVDMTGWDDANVDEGTAVVNQRGELVGLCSRTPDGTELITLTDLDELRRQTVTTPSTGKAWLGIMVNDTPAGMPSIGAVDPAGPAALAGLAVGDVIVSVDGIAVSASTAIIDALAAHVPGDVVIVTVQRGGLTVELPVELGVPKTTL